ncbi:MAG TPA: hypothetical protein VN693_00040 [Rhodanobacteraceae bacterium]|nr:hypothetical protein [Rhodanobacteraceae bacterium]
MTRKTETEPMLRGRAPHRRTQTDYMAALLDRVPLETWGEVIDATVAKAKDGDAQSRAFLAAYLVGKPTVEASSPLSVTASRLAGDDPLVARLAKPAIERFDYPTLHRDDDSHATIRARVANELPALIEPQA